MAGEMSPREASKLSEEQVAEYKELVERNDPNHQGITLDTDIEVLSDMIAENGSKDMMQYRDSLMREKESIDQAKAANIARARESVEQNSGAYHDAARIDAMLDGVKIQAEKPEPK